MRSFFATPSDSGLQPVLDEIASAKKSIRMMMFHLTVPEIETALSQAASRGVDVKIILDAKNLEKRGAGDVAQRLTDHHVTIVRASNAFSIMHAKAMVIDDAKCVIMSLNLTRPYDHTRDYAIVTDDAGVIDEFLRVFDADLTNAEHQTSSTPALANAALVWSPVDAEARLVSLVDSAQHTVDATTENLSDHAMEGAFARATKRGVKVRLLAPACDLGGDAYRNDKPILELEKKNVDARVMPSPSTRDQPYMHAKMIIVDDARAFVGSINFSENSMKHARELGIVFEDRPAITAFTAAFEADWRFAAPPPEKPDGSCKREPD